MPVDDVEWSHGSGCVRSQGVPGASHAAAPSSPWLTFGWNGSAFGGRTDERTDGREIYIKVIPQEKEREEDEVKALGRLKTIKPKDFAERAEDKVR